MMRTFNFLNIRRVLVLSLTNPPASPPAPAPAPVPTSVPSPPAAPSTHPPAAPHPPPLTALTYLRSSID
jgi:hypothetical protein